ncbi:uncharacterized protein PAC_05595 [Phialocephala subalpina]|uniref:Uncharacterized protein n=1 Tax=Phialocephala subalpina TaxID=576137 RepID=A0A1L7WSG9_9HELO|nr:uncharacterized protein PAC_05595 [Phialocephala subalpina]
MDSSTSAAPEQQFSSLTDQLRPRQDIITVCSKTTRGIRIEPGFSFSFHCAEVTPNSHTLTFRPIDVIAGRGEKGKLHPSAWMPIIAEGRMRLGEKAIFKTRAIDGNSIVAVSREEGLTSSWSEYPLKAEEFKTPNIGWRDMTEQKKWWEAFNCHDASQAVASVGSRMHWQIDPKNHHVRAGWFSPS